jgi:hypothetical protein
MSGHQPETMACGVLSCVVDLLSELSGVPWLDVYGLFFFLTTGSMKATAIFMQLQQKGWRHKHGAPRLKKAAEMISRSCAELLDHPEIFVAHDGNNVDAWFPGVKYLVDTAPIYVNNIGQSESFYQPKYAAHVAKIIGVVTCTGFFVHRSALYQGPMHDNACAVHMFLEDLLKTHDRKCLADGVFKRSPLVIIPFNKREIPIDYDSRIEVNGKISHIRARVEHSFARLGRFAAFKVWNRPVDDFLEDCMACCMIALNVEILLRHGPGGFAIKLPESPLESIAFQKDRYPKDEQKKKKQPPLERNQPTLLSFIKRQA